MITVLDYGGGNLKSIVNALNALGVEFRMTDEAEDVLNAERLIFPGQGHFGQVMEALKFRGLAEPLRRKLNEGMPFLGICVGLQVLFEASEEAPGIEGLSIFKGRNVRFTEGKIPQIGWNKIKTTEADSVLKDDYFYFVNSFHAVPEDASIVSAIAEYGRPFTAAVQRNNIAATQFHPEKSGAAGQEVLRRWVESFGIETEK